jgi:hypothetical protein
VILYVKVSYKIIKSGANDIPCVAVFLERGKHSLSCSNINVTYRAHVTVVMWKEGYQEMCFPTSTPFPDLDTCYGHDGLVQT